MNSMATDMDFAVQLLVGSKQSEIIQKILDARQRLSSNGKPMAHMAFERMVESLISWEIISPRELGFELQKFVISSENPGLNMYLDLLVKAYAKWLLENTQVSHFEEQSKDILEMFVWIYDQISFHGDAGTANQILRNHVPKLERVAVEKMYVDLKRKGHSAATPIGEGLAQLVGIEALLDERYPA